MISYLPDLLILRIVSFLKLPDIINLMESYPFLES